ncbi:MAG: transporter substrate-binding domain-containing protein [Spirochaetia bacterium]
MKRSRVLLSVLLTLIVLSALLLLLPLTLQNPQPEAFVPLLESQNLSSDSKTTLQARGDWGYPPFEFINDQGEPDGFNIAILRRIAELMNLNIEISLGPWDTVRQELEQGDIDLLAGMYKTAERDKAADFTIPHFISSYGVFVRDGSHINSIEDIQDKRILVQAKDVGHDYLLEQEIAAEILTVDSWEDLLPALESGRADCAVLSMLQGMRQLQQQGIRGVRLIPQPLFQQKYSIAVQEGNAELLATMNAGLALLKSTGEYDQIFERWFGVYTDQGFSSFSLLSSPWLRFVLGIFLLGALLLAGFFFWTYALKRQVNRKTAQLSSALENLTRANEAKNRFLASVSHELRTPLHGILGMCRMLDTTPLDAEQQEMLEMLHSSSNQLHRVLSDLIDVNRLESGNFSLYPTDFYLHQIGSWIEPLLRKAAADKGLDFRFEVTNDQVLLHADRERLVQIVLNLAENAIKNTSVGGVEVRLAYSESLLHIVVEDTGSGIPKDKQEIIFAPFTHLDGNNQSVLGNLESGLGLGLSIVKSIVSLLHGDIGIESHVGRGSTFTITLPVEVMTVASPVTGASKAASVKVSAVSAKKLKILVAEDEGINRLYLEQFLRSKGWDTVPAADGEQAWKLLQGESFDLVLMDVSMPKLTGLDVCRKVRQLEESQQRKRSTIIALTAFADDENRQKCRDVGMDGFVSKPFKEQKLIEEIELLV